AAALRDSLLDATRRADVSDAAAARLEEAISQLPEGVVVCDGNGDIVVCTEQAAPYLSPRHGDVLAERVVTELLQNARGGRRELRTVELYGPPRRTLAVSAVPPPAGAVALIEDVTDRRRLESVRRDFVANVSHELKTPVGALTLLAETLTAEDDVEVTRRLAERILAEGQRLARIIEDLLDLSRIESEESHNHEPIAADALVREAVDRVRPSADPHRITLEVGEVSPRLTIVGDRRQLVSALVNLLENAVTY